MIGIGTQVGQLLRWAVPAAALLWTGSAMGAPIVDQSTLILNYPEDAYILSNTINRSLSGPGNRLQSQDVTAGITGRLTRVDLQIIRYNFGTAEVPLTLSIYANSRIDPSTRLVGSVEIAAASIPEPFEFDEERFVSLDVAGLMFDVDVGDVFSLQLSASAPGSTFGFVYGWDKDVDDDNDDPSKFSFIHYAGGTNYISNDGGATFAPTLYDRGFRTFVDPAPVPEPTPLGLLALGLISVAAYRRTSQSKRLA